MALQTSGITLPRSVALEITGKAKDTSTIAALSTKRPEIFADDTVLVFTGGSEAEVVEEGAQKGSYDQAISAVTGKRFTVQTTTRVSNQLIWADEDNQLEIISAIQDDQAQALGRALDYVIYHAIQPKDGTALTSYTALASQCAQVALGAKLSAVTDAKCVEAFDNLVEAVNDLYEVNGIALSKKFANRLRKIRVENTMARLYPEIPLNLNVGTFEGVNAVASGTVNARLKSNGEGKASGGNTHAFLGDFNAIRWGAVRDIRAEIIEYGDPDGQGDLKRLNQVAYRTEAVYAYAITDPKAIAVLNATAE